MKRKFSKAFLYLLVTGICNFSIACLAQANAGTEEVSLRGKWTFESVAAFNGDVQQSFDMNDQVCEIPAVIDIRQDEVSFVWKERTSVSKFNDVVKGGNGFCFCPCGEWKIVDNKLQLLWTQHPKGDDKGKITIIAIYKSS